MSRYPFSVEHLVAALARVIYEDDAQDVLEEAKRLAETKQVRLSDLQQGDFATISWYLPKREAYITGNVIVTKVDDQGVHVEPHSNFGNHSFGDGETDLSLVRGIGPLGSKRLPKIVQSAWRVVPFGSGEATS